MTPVNRVVATDADSGLYGQFSYQFVGDDAHKYFRINENTGSYIGYLDTAIIRKVMRVIVLN